MAGPNGAGKTTFAREFLPNEANCPDFINVDLTRFHQRGPDSMTKQPEHAVLRPDDRS